LGIKNKSKYDKNKAVILFSAGTNEFIKITKCMNHLGIFTKMKLLIYDKMLADCIEGA